MILPVSLDWGTMAAIISAMVDVIQLGRDSFQAYFEKRKQDPRFAERGAALEQAFSTYAPEEVEAIADRINSCKDRFAKEGSGKNRVRCLCSVLRDVKDGNGGSIPDPEWQKAYDKLNCASA